MRNCGTSDVGAAVITAIAEAAKFCVYVEDSVCVTVFEFECVRECFSKRNGSHAIGLVRRGPCQNNVLNRNRLRRFD